MVQPYPPHPGYPPARSRPVAPDEGLPPPLAFQPVAGTPFGLAMVGVPPTVSGPATASLVAGIGSIAVSLVVGCFGLLGANAGWGPMVAGAFAVLALFAGAVAVWLGRLGLRQVRRGRGEVRGHGLAVTGVSCGSVGLGITALGFILALALVHS